MKAALWFGEIEHEGDVSATFRQLNDIDGVAVNGVVAREPDEALIEMEVPDRFTNLAELKDWLRDQDPDLILGGF